MYIAGTLNVFHGRGFVRERVNNYVSYNKFYGLRQYLECNGTSTSELIQLRFVLKNLRSLAIQPLKPGGIVIRYFIPDKGFPRDFLGCFNMVTRETFRVFYSNGKITLLSSLYGGKKLFHFQTL